MKVKSESEVTQSCPTLNGPVDYSLPGSSVHGIFQARVLEWGAIAFYYRLILTAVCDDMQQRAKTVRLIFEQPKFNENCLR